MARHRQPLPMKNYEDLLVTLTVTAILVTFGLFLASIVWGW